MVTVTGLIRMFDASAPPARPFPGCQAVAGYLGGNTPHTWTAAEWNGASDQGRLPQLPVWVGFGEDDPVMHAELAADTALHLGFECHHRPYWRAIVADVENVREEAWLLAFGHQLQARGFLCFPYNSAAALPADPPGYSVWLAQWDGLDDVPAIHDVVGHQYAHDIPFAGTAVDLSAFDAGVAERNFGRGLRR